MAALGLAVRAAGVHKAKRRFGVLRDGGKDLVEVIFQQLVDEEIAVHDHRRVGGVFAGIAPPDKDLVNVLALFFGGLHGDVRAGFVVHPLAVAVIAVGINQDAAAGIGGAEAASFAAETAEECVCNKPCASGLTP